MFREKGGLGGIFRKGAGVEACLKRGWAGGMFREGGGVGAGRAMA
jgi:hypothetical protein